MSQLHPIVNLTPDKNYITPDYTKPYTPAKESIEFFSWVNTVLGKEDTPSPKTHFMLMDELLKDAEPFLALCHRGFAKSTLTTKYLPLYIAHIGSLPQFGRVVNLAIFSATYSQSISLMKDLRAAWATSDVLQDTLKLAVGKDGKTIANKENHICFENSNGQWIHIQAWGSGDQIRGAKVPDENSVGHRLELLLFDDILKDNIIESPKERTKLKQWYFSSVLPAVNPSHHREIMVGTPMHQTDLLMEFLNSPEYRAIKFPIASKMPAPLDEIISSWKSFHSPEEIKKSYNQAKSINALGDWYRERMLEVVNRDTQVFKEDWFTDYHYETMKREFASMNFFTTIDMAVADKSREGKVAIITIGVDAKNHWWVVKANNGYFNPSEAIDILFEHNKMFASFSTRGEKAALQQVLDHFLEKEMDKRKIWFNVDYVSSNSAVSKESRVYGLEPIAKRRRIHFPLDMDVDAVDELKAQLFGFTRDGFTTPFKDMADALANFTDQDFVFYPSSWEGTEVGPAWENQEDDFDY